MAAILAVPGFFNLGNLLVGQRRSTFDIGPAQERAFGILPANATPGEIDGIIGIGTGISAGALRIVACLHEIGHALGRVAGTELDLFRFTSPASRLFTTSVPAPPAYFSVDGGATKLADWGQNSDPSDFLGPTSILPSNQTPNDPYDEHGGNLTNLTNVDQLVMESLGFSNAPPPLSLKFVGTGDFTAGGLADVASLAFAGHLSWQTAADALDLSDTKYGANTRATFSGNTDGGTLAVTDGSNTAQIALLGNYTTSGWTVSRDGAGGTIVVDQPQTASPLGESGASSVAQRVALLNQYMSSMLTDESFWDTGAPMSSDPASGHEPTLTKSPVQLRETIRESL